MRTWLRLLLLTLPVCAATAAAPARAEKITIDDDTFVNIGVLLQPQFTVTENASPSGDLGTDFYLRRARLVLTGQYDANIGFILITDQANWGRNGDYTSQFIVQDAVAYYKFSSALTVSAGFTLLPFVRMAYQSAGGLNTVDYRLSVIKFPPTGRAFRDMGAEVRGLLAGDRIYYRAGVFSGINGSVDDMGNETNPSDVPRLTGNLRFNILGKEEGYAVPAISFGTEPIVNVGVGFDWQKDAFGDGDDARYLALSADVFVDYPMPGDQELAAQAAYFHYDNYAQGGLVEAGDGFYVEGGYRFMKIEPVAAIEYFKGDSDGTQIITYRAGINFWISKHNYNLKAEIAIPDAEELPDGTEPPNNIIGTLQAQVVF
jgi:hypothetical protein